MNNLKPTWMQPIIAIAFLSLLLCSCSNPGEPFTAKDFEGIYLKGDSVHFHYQKAVPSARTRTRCDKTTWQESICAPRDVDTTFAQQGKPVNAEEAAKKMNARMNKFYGLDVSWLDRVYPIKTDLATLLLLLLLLLLLWALLRNLLSGRRSRNAIENLGRSIERLHDQIARNGNRPVEQASTVTQTAQPEKLKVEAEGFKLDLESPAIHYPLVVTVKGPDDKVTKSLTIGSGKYQTPQDAGSGIQQPPTSTAP